MANNQYIRYECDFKMNKPIFLDTCKKAALKGDPICYTTQSNFLAHLMMIDGKTVVVNYATGGIVYIKTFSHNSVTIMMTETSWHLFSYAFKRIDELYKGVIGTGDVV